MGTNYIHWYNNLQTANTSISHFSSILIFLFPCSFLSTYSLWERCLAALRITGVNFILRQAEFWLHGARVQLPPPRRPLMWFSRVLWKAMSPLIKHYLPGILFTGLNQMWRDIGSCVLENKQFGISWIRYNKNVKLHRASWFLLSFFHKHLVGASFVPRACNVMSASPVNCELL